jgi:hypothetical protein
MPGPRPQELIVNLGYIFIDLQAHALTPIINTIVIFNSMLNDVQKKHCFVKVPRLRPFVLVVRVIVI